jgi:sulfate adenylyltransferase (ADP) / ATP adenylyltransferase
MQGGGLAYYNCGPSSGASQPHKHVQVVPLPLAEGLHHLTPMSDTIKNSHEAQASSEGECFELRSFPFRSYASLLSDR